MSFTATAAPLIVAEAPGHLQAVTQPFGIGGWAIDASAASGTGVSYVDFASYPNPGSGQAVVSMGSGNYGQARSTRRWLMENWRICDQGEGGNP